jgi:hypothetical protein
VPVVAELGDPLMAFASQYAGAVPPVVSRWCLAAAGLRWTPAPRSLPALSSRPSKIDEHPVLLCHVGEAEQKGEPGRERVNARSLVESSLDERWRSDLLGTRAGSSAMRPWTSAQDRGRQLPASWEPIGIRRGACSARTPCGDAVYRSLSHVGALSQVLLWRRPVG